MAIEMKFYPVKVSKNWSGRVSEWGEITLEDALELYNGKLYELLCNELVLLNEHTDQLQDAVKSNKTLAKQLTEAGIKPIPIKESN